MLPVIPDTPFCLTKLQNSCHHDASTFYAPPDLMERLMLLPLPQILSVHMYLRIQV